MKITMQLGKLANSTKGIQWTSDVNAHLNICGQSGQRKTTLLRKLGSQLPGQGVHVVIVDCAGDFCDNAVTYPSTWPPPETRIINVRSVDAPISSMAPYPLSSGGYESPNQYADRIAGVLQNALRLGSKQWAYLYNILKEDFASNNASSVSYLVRRIEEDAPDYPEAQRLKSRLAALNDFPETDERCYEAFKKPGMTVIDAQDLRSTTLRSLVTEILLGNLYAYKLSNQEACPMIVILDECQHLRFDNDSMAQIILREGRKYDFAGWFSSQWIDKPAAAKALSQAALQIYFRPDDATLEQTARRLTQSTPQYRNACKRELMRLRPGQFYCLKNGLPIKVDGNSDTGDER